MLRLTVPRAMIGTIALLGTLAGLLDAQLLPAQEETSDAMLRLLEPGAFEERYLQHLPPEPDRGATVGAIIVGVRLDGPAAPFDPASLRVRLGDAPAPSERALCLKVISRDGHYFARGRYNADNGTEPTPRVEYRTAYGAVLANYSNRDIALYAYKSAYCDRQTKVEDQTKAEFFAAQLTPAVSANKLVVQLRAGEARLHAQLFRDEAPVSQRVLCNRIQTGPTVGYSVECAITLFERLPSGRYLLNIGETDSTGDIQVKTYPVSLWPGT